MSHSLNRSSNTVKAIRSRILGWACHVDRTKEGTSPFKILTTKPTGKRPLGRPRRRWEDNIRIGIKKIVINA